MTYCCRTLASAFGAQVICNRMVGLTADQRRICAAAPDAMGAVGHGIRIAKHECQQQFSTHRWNCTGPTKGNALGHLQITGKSPIAGTIAVVHYLRIRRFGRRGRFKTSGFSLDRFEFGVINFVRYAVVSRTDELWLSNFSIESKNIPKVISLISRRLIQFTWD